MLDLNQIVDWDGKYQIEQALVPINLKVGQRQHSSMRDLAILRGSLNEGMIAFVA